MFKSKKVLVLLCMIMMLTMPLSTFANTSSTEWQNDSIQGFTDVPKGYWAYDAISVMAGRKIMEGNNGRFNPEGIVSRAQFAKMLVVALNLPLKNPSKGTFKDIGKNNWEYKYVETAKSYLTGFRTSSGDCFKPASDLLREDMAVALVKALGYGNEAADESMLNTISDRDNISKNLRKYVTIALKHELINTEKIENSDQRLLSPKSSITRASAAVLLCSILQEEKVTYDGDSENDVIDSPKDTKKEDKKDGYTVPKVWTSTENGKIVLKWQQIKDDRLQGYKVVISKENPKPKYPEDGYLYYFTDVNTTSAVIDNSTPYNGGDFGKYLEAGEEYYFSVTAVYDSKTVPGSAIKVKYTE